MDIKGYSERGLINSLFYEIAYSSNGYDLLDELLSLIEFPNYSFDFNLKKISILIEQSFSDFGDSDIVMLLDNEEFKQSGFFEVKVKTYSRKQWSISEEFYKFIQPIKGPEENDSENKVSSSNLFAQLYYKQRLVKALKTEGIEALREGIQFGDMFSKTKRKIGSNAVVINAAERLKNYLDDTFFVALVPDSDKILQDFFNEVLSTFIIDELEGWEIDFWGYLSWEKVEKFCLYNRLEATLEVFEFNKGQIY